MSPIDAEWPRQPGSYVLLFDIPAPLTFESGRLGRIVLPAGQYAYVGSARGPGGLRGRLTRHLRSNKRLFWHIDYLTQYATISAVYWQETTEPLECRWAQTLLQLPGASAPVRGFGSSDCRHGCPAHLIRLPDGLQNAGLIESLTPSPHSVTIHARSPDERGCYN